MDCNGLNLARSRTMSRRLAGTLGALLLWSCAASPAAPEIDPETRPRSEPIGIGESVILAESGFQLTLDGIEGDSRCPVDVVCVTAGQIRVSGRLLPLPAGAGNIEEVVLSDSRPTTVLGYSLRIVQANPLPRSTVTIPARSYRFVIEVTRALE
jgi:hypothetical protein